jgi:hypothetical protein
MAHRILSIQNGFISWFRLDITKLKVPSFKMINDVTLYTLLDS